MGLKELASTVLTKAEESWKWTFRKQTLLPLDGRLYALQVSVPKLARSSLHRCLQCSNISRLPDSEGGQPMKKNSNFHIDIAHVRTEKGKFHLLVALDRTSQFVMAKLNARATMAEAQTFLEELIQSVLYIIHPVLTDSGIQSAIRERIILVRRLCSEGIPLIGYVVNMVLNIN